MPNGSPRGQYWILTIPAADFEPSEELLSGSDGGLGFIMGQREIGESGYEHWQLVAYFKKRVYLSAVKEVFGETAHAELSRSRRVEEYVQKDATSVDGSRFEFGTRPFKRNSEKDWDDIKRKCIDGELDDIPSDVFIRCYASLRRIRADYAKPEAVVRTVNCFWGDTGTGKSRRAWEEAGLDAYPKSPSTKFWDGYQGHKHVVIDEFTGQIGIEHLLRWFDRYPVLVEIKGSAMVLKASSIWITSNVDPKDWYKDAPPEQVAALLRRLNIIHFMDTLRRMGL
nr:MAG: replication polyprotein [Chemarfal virus 193]